eukprot:jgi/Hompol1/2158/HPOL_002067-RA
MQETASTLADSNDLSEYSQQEETSAAEMSNVMRQLIKRQRQAIDTSNATEFLSSQRTGAARVDMIEIDRQTQIKQNTVHNSTGPLDRSTFSNQDVPRPLSTQPYRTSQITDACDERVANIEAHLGLPTVHDWGIVTRIKAIEDHISSIEASHPEFAMRHFSQTDVLASAVTSASGVLSDRLFSIAGHQDIKETEDEASLAVLHHAKVTFI